MPSIGGVSCDFVREESFNDLKLRVEIWQVPGLDGYGAQDLGFGDSNFRYRCVKYGTESEIETWFGNLEALQATIISATDDWGRTRHNLLVRHVEVIGKRPAPPNYQCRGEATVEGVVTQ